MTMKTYAAGYGPNPTQTQWIAMKEILKTSPAFEVIDIAFDKKTLQRQMGANMVFRRWLTPAVDSTPAPEGTTKEARTLAFLDFPGTVLRYTERIQVSRVDYDLSPFDAVMGAKARMRDLILSTRERIRWNAATAGTNVRYNSTAVTARNQVNGPMTPGGVQAIVRSIASVKGDLFTNDVGGAAKEGTAPVEGSYYWFGHTDQEPDWRSFPGFQIAASYPNGSKKHYREFGAWQNVRYFSTPEAIKLPGAGAASTTMLNTAGVADVYLNVVCAKDALASVKLAGDGKEGFGNLGIKVLDQPDKYDPNNSWVDIVASWYDCAMITSQEWLWRGEQAATANL